MKELKKKIARFTMPEPINAGLYEVRKQMLAHRLKETAHLNATLLIWQAQEAKK